MKKRFFFILVLVATLSLLTVVLARSAGASISTVTTGDFAFPADGAVTSRSAAASLVNTSNQAIIGPSGCVDYGDPFSTAISGSSENGFEIWAGPNDYVETVPSVRCLPGECASQWVDPPYVITVPENLGNCDWQNPTPADCTPFYGGRLMVRADAGSGNTFVWDVSRPAEVPAGDVTAGCAAFPIAIHEAIRSVTPPGEGANPYPDAGEFTYPLSPPPYQSFTNHVPDLPLAQAEEGVVYRVQNGSGAGNFAWLVWNVGINPTAQTLANSLTWPGDSTDYTDHGDGGTILPGFSHVVRGYVEPDDPTDTAMHVGDWVAASTGSMNANVVQNALKSHIDSGGMLRLIVWTDSEGTGSGARYQIAGFALFRIHGYRASQGAGGPWLLLEFIRWDTTCGQLVIMTYLPVTFNK